MTFWKGDLPLPESQLRDFCKTLPRIIGTSQEPELSSNFVFILDQLIRTAYDPSIGVGHLGATINAICSLAGLSKSLLVKEPWSDGRWFRAFSIVLDRSEGSKSKPLRQLMICLINALGTFSDAENQRVLDRATRIVLQVLLQESDHVKAKPALQVLNHLLSRNILSLSNLIECSRTSRDSLTPGTHHSLTKAVELKWLLQMIFGLVRFPDTAIAAGHASRTLGDRISQDGLHGPAPNEPLWASPLINVLRENVEDFRNYRSHLLPDLFKVEVQHYMQFLKILGFNKIFDPEQESLAIDRTDAIILFTCLEVGKENGIAVDSAVNQGQVRNNIVHIPDTALEKVVENASDSLRLSGLSLIISSVSITRPFTPEALRCLKRNFSHLLMETDVHVRGEVLVLVQRLIDRLKAATFSLSRAVDRGLNGRKVHTAAASFQMDESSSKRLILVHRRFLRSFLVLAKAQLHPAATYQRHICGLRTIIILAKSGIDERLPHSQLSKQAQAKEATRWAFHEPIFDAALSRLLQDLLMDPFEDVRSFAASLLVMQASTTSALNQEMYSKLFKRAEHLMLSTGRADHADGVSRVNALIFETAHIVPDANGSSISRNSHMNSLIGRLESRILLANDDMRLAVGKFPLHGVLASIRLILDNPNLYDELHMSSEAVWYAYHHRLVKALSEVWQCVKGVLCNDAPEGYMPEDMEEEVSITTKDVLSYCWRALKEASALLRVLISRASVGDGQSCLLSWSQFEMLSRLAFTELVELRHRGAFSTVAQAFAACCSRASALRRDDLLLQLFINTLSAIQAKSSAITRRSAGLPSLVVGIFGACPATPLFQQGMNDLIAEAAVEPKEHVVYGDALPQVHALNCIREVFIITVLGQYSEPFISPCLNLAGKCLTSEIWAIRNCGLMLFRALIGRLLGSTDSRHWSEDTKEVLNPRSSFNEFPNLMEITLALLEPASAHEASNRSALESVFPALKLVQRIRPLEESRAKFRKLVLRLCQSPHWHVRDMAARTYATLVPSAERCSTAASLIPVEGVVNNSAHGQLLCILCVTKLELRSSATDMVAVDALEKALNAERFRLTSLSTPPFCSVAYIDIINLLGMYRLMRSAEASAGHFTLSEDDIGRVFEQSPAIRTPFALNVLLQYIFSSRKSDENETTSSHSETPTLLEYLQLLSQVDARACLQILEQIVDIVRNIPASCLQAITGYLSFAASQSDSPGPHLVGSSRLLLVKIYEALDKDDCIFQVPLRPDDMSRTLQCADSMPPSLLESTLLLWGPLLNKGCLSPTTNYDLLDEFDFLAASVRPLIHERQPFDLRMAVARCISSIPNFWKQSFGADSPHRIDSMRVKFIFLVYDLLNDDDDEIRGISVAIAAEILNDGESSSKTQHVVPLLASQRLIAHLQLTYSHLSEIFDQAILRIKGMHTQSSIGEAFANVAVGNTALFAVEKQNLFIDPVREAILWSQLLKSPHHARLLPRAAARDFVRWTKEGLRLLHGYLQENVDGVLGWASKPDMFVFGTQIWCAVDVVLVWERRFVKNVTIISPLMDGLVRYLTLARAQEVHDIWLDKIEKMLTRELRARMGESIAVVNLRSVAACINCC